MGNAKFTRVLDAEELLTAFDAFHREITGRLYYFGLGEDPWRDFREKNIIFKECNGLIEEDGV